MSMWGSMAGSRNGPAVTMMRDCAESTRTSMRGAASVWGAGCGCAAGPARIAAAAMSKVTMVYSPFLLGKASSGERSAIGSGLPEAFLHFDLDRREVRHVGLA